MVVVHAVKSLVCQFLHAIEIGYELCCTTYGPSLTVVRTERRFARVAARKLTVEYKIRQLISWSFFFASHTHHDLPYIHPSKLLFRPVPFSPRPVSLQHPNQHPSHRQPPLPPIIPIPIHQLHIPRATTSLHNLPLPVPHNQQIIPHSIIALTPPPPSTPLLPTLPTPTPRRQRTLTKPETRQTRSPRTFP